MHGKADGMLLLVLLMQERHLESSRGNEQRGGYSSSVLVCRWFVSLDEEHAVAGVPVHHDGFFVCHLVC
jgi:hypothetical protein